MLNDWLPALAKLLRLHTTKPASVVQPAPAKTNSMPGEIGAMIFASVAVWLPLLVTVAL